MNRREFTRLCTVASLLSASHGQAAADGKEELASSSPVRARDLGISPGVFPPGKLNAITDIDGVSLGHTTLIEGDSVRTGVTAILPHKGNVYREKVPGAVYIGNAFGKLAGSTQVNELGTIETPIVLTNTLSVGVAVEAVVRYTLATPGNESRSGADFENGVFSVNALVGETNDFPLNDIRGLHVKPEHVLAAIRNATQGPVEEGCVGAGTGTVCFGWKGGIGTSSRSLPAEYGGYLLGALVQTNYGGLLTIDGVPVGREFGQKMFPSAGSCMIVLATNAPLDSHGLYRLAKRAIIGLARTGDHYSNDSGEYAIAFSTFPGNRRRHGAEGVFSRQVLSTDSIDPLFQCALEAVEEAVYNSMLMARTTTANGHTVEALPVDRLRELLREYRPNNKKA